MIKKNDLTIILTLNSDRRIQFQIKNYIGFYTYPIGTKSKFDKTTNSIWDNAKGTRNFTTKDLHIIQENFLPFHSQSSQEQKLRQILLQATSLF